MQVNTISAQLGVGSELVDWHRAATSVLYGHLLVDWLPLIDDRLCYRTDTGSNPSKFYVPDRLKMSNLLEDQHLKFLHSPSDPIIFPQTEKLIPSVLPKRVYQVPLGMYSELSQRKLAKHKKTSRDKNLKRHSVAHSERNHLDSKKRRTGIRKWVTNRKINYSSRHQPFVLIWSSLFSSLLLCTTTATK